MAVIGREQLVHLQSGRGGARPCGTHPRRRLARAVEITVLGWLMSLLAVSLERILASHGEGEHSPPVSFGRTRFADPKEPLAR